MKSKASSAILVTSQRVVGFTTFDLSLNPFNQEEGSRLLFQGLKDALRDRYEFEQAMKISREISSFLGGSPLDLSWGVGYMNLTNSPRCLEEYLERIRETSNTLGGKSDKLWRYDRLASATHDFILRQLSPEAKQFLYMCATLNPDDIGEDLLIFQHHCEENAFLRFKTT